MNTYTTTVGQVRRRKFFSRRVISGILAILEGAIVIGSALALLVVYVLPNDTQFLSDYLVAIVIYTILFWQSLYWCKLYRLGRYAEPQSNIVGQF